MSAFRAALFTLVLGFTVVADETPKRKAVPPRDEQVSAEKQVHETFKDDYSKRSRTDLDALAHKLLAVAEQPQPNRALLYVLLRDARDMAATAGDIKTATAAADRMAETFQVGRAAERASVLLLAGKAPLTGASAVDFVNACLSMADELVGADDYEPITKLLAAAEVVARQDRDGVLPNRVAEKEVEVRSLKAAYQHAAPAVAKLKNDSSNASLNLTAGKYYCLDKKDWEHGLEYLSQGSDNELKQIATTDLGSPDTASDRVALGDRYWQVAAHAKGPAKAAFQSRACFWYAKAVSSLEGLAKTRVQERLSSDELWKLHNLVAQEDSKGGEPTSEGVELNRGGIFTPTEVRVPVRIDAVAKTESASIRLTFGKHGVVIFNWEEGPEELRFHTPDSGTILPTPGKGHVPINSWVHLTWIIEPTRATVLVEGRQRAVFKGNYAGLSGKAGISGPESKIWVRQFDVTQGMSR